MASGLLTVWIETGFPLLTRLCLQAALSAFRVHTQKAFRFQSCLRKSGSTGRASMNQRRKFSCLMLTRSSFGNQSKPISKRRSCI